MACEPIVFQGITRERWQEIEDELRANGIHVEHDKGTEHISHLDLAWDYDESTQTLAITCTGKPFVVSCKAVNSKIRELFEAGERK